MTAVGRIEHGTARGFSQHQQRNEEPCARCKAGKAEYDHDRNLNPEVRRLRAIRNTAAHLARKEVVRRHKAEYKLLYRRNVERLLADRTA